MSAGINDLYQLNNSETINLKSNEKATAKPKSYLNATNLILGSLATIGVLGAADILLCKGKHINKFSSKGKELEEAISRATAAETQLSAAERQIIELENSLQKNKEIIEILKDNLGIKNIDDKNIARSIGSIDIETLPRGKGLLRDIRNLYAGIEGYKKLDSQNKERLLEWLSGHNYKFIDHTSPEYMKYAEYFSEKSANVPHRDTSVPILINTKNGECVIDEGVIVNPLS